MATAILQGHSRRVEIVTGPQSELAWRENLIQMLVEEGYRLPAPMPWYARKWRRVMRFFATVWACIVGRPAQMLAPTPMMCPPSRRAVRRAARRRRARRCA